MIRLIVIVASSLDTLWAFGPPEEGRYMVWAGTLVKYSLEVHAAATVDHDQLEWVFALKRDWRGACFYREGKISLTRDD